MKAPFPSQIYAIELRPIDFKGQFFKSIRDAHQLPISCTFKWGDNKQDAEGYFFPSSVYSVSDNDYPESDVAGALQISLPV